MFYQWTIILVFSTWYLIWCVPNTFKRFLTGIWVSFPVIRPVVTILAVIPDIVTFVIGVLCVVYEVVVINIITIARLIKEYAIIVVRDVIIRDDIDKAIRSELYAIVVRFNVVVIYGVDAGIPEVYTIPIA